MKSAHAKLAVAGSVAILAGAAFLSREAVFSPVPPSSGAPETPDGRSGATKLHPTTESSRAGQVQPAAAAPSSSQNTSVERPDATTQPVKAGGPFGGMKAGAAPSASAVPTGRAAEAPAWQPSEEAVKAACKLLALFKEKDAAPEAIAAEVKRGLALTEQLTRGVTSQLSNVPAGDAFNALVADTYSAYELARGYTMAFERGVVTNVADYQKLVDTGDARLNGILNDTNGVSNRVVGQLLGPGYNSYITSAVNDPAWARQNRYFLTQSVHQQLLARGMQGSRR